jgi:hypothetical protein
MLGGLLRLGLIGLSETSVVTTFVPLIIVSQGPLKPQLCQRRSYIRSMFLEVPPATHSLSYIPKTLMFEENNDMKNLWIDR